MAFLVPVVRAGEGAKRQGEAVLTPDDAYN